MNRACRWRFAICAGVVASLGALSTGVTAQPVTLDLATQTTAGTAQFDGAVRFAQLVDQKTGHRIAVNVAGDGTLGGDLQVLSALQRGTIAMALMNAGLLNGLAKEFTILDLPFQFDNEDEAHAVLDGSFGRRLLDLLPQHGVVGLAFPELGFQQIHNGKHPVRRMADLGGLKIRTVQTPIAVDTVKALGANAVPLPFPELYHALERKVVDGATDPLVTIAVLGFDHVQGYLTLTRHTYNAQVLLISRTAFERLAPADRAALQEAATAARDYERDLSRARNAQALDQLKKTMQVVELGPAESAKMREAVAPVIDRYSRLAGESLSGALAAEVAKVRAQK